MTTEEKAIEYAFANPQFGIRSALIAAYLAGATEALRSQWRDASKELPEEDAIGRSCDVFVKLSRKNGICDTYRGHTFRGVWHVEAPFKVTSKVLFWMKLPPLPDTEEQ